MTSGLLRRRHRPPEREEGPPRQKQQGALASADNQEWIAALIHPLEIPGEVIPDHGGRTVRPCVVNPGIDPQGPHGELPAFTPGMNANEAALEIRGANQQDTLLSPAGDFHRFP